MTAYPDDIPMTALLRSRGVTPGEARPLAARLDTLANDLDRLHGSTEAWPAMKAAVCGSPQGLMRYGVNVPQTSDAAALCRVILQEGHRVVARFNRNDATRLHPEGTHREWADTVNQRGVRQ